MLHYKLDILIILLFFCSCSNEIEIGTSLLPTEEAPVPIRISSEWIGASTKSKVTEFAEENVKSIGIFGISGTDILYNNIYPNQINNGQLVFNTPPLVYPASGKTVKLSGYYPKEIGTIQGNLFHFTITGTEDLMYAPIQQAGSKKEPNPVSLVFAHKLTCVSFKLINSITDSELTLPTETISIITQAPNKGTLNLESGVIAVENSYSEYTLNSNLTLLDLKEVNPVAGELMLFPVSTETGVTEYQFQLLIDDLKYPITINEANKPAWEAGRSYALTITINSLTPLTKTSTAPHYELIGTVCERTK